MVARKKTEPAALAKVAKKKELLVTQQVVDRILLELGAKMTAPVKGRFLRCLIVSVRWYEDAILYNHSGPQKEQRKYLRELKTAIRRLSPLVNVERMPANLRGFLPVLAPFANLPTDLETLNRKLKRVEELRSNSRPETGLESDFIDALIYQDHFKERAPFEWLVGVYLPEIYFLFFSYESGWGQGSKYLSFAAIVLRAMKIKTGKGTYYTKKAVSRAVRINPDLAIRRKNGPRVDNDVPDQLEWYRHMHWMGAIGLRLKDPIEHAKKVLADLNVAK